MKLRDLRIRTRNGWRHCAQLSKKRSCAVLQWWLVAVRTTVLNVQKLWRFSFGKNNRWTAWKPNYKKYVHSWFSGHSSAAVVAKLMKLASRFLQYPSYSPDLAPSNCYFCPIWQNYRRENIFPYENVIAVTNREIEEILLFVRDEQTEAVLNEGYKPKRRLCRKIKKDYLMK